MISPITGKEMKVQHEAASLSFRKEDFNIISHYYLCEESGEKFTDDYLDNLNLTQVYNQYREKYGIPFPEEIKQIRNLYDVSASKMSEILGLGPNSYRLYEAGEMPSVAIGRLLLSIKQPSEFIKQVKASSHLLSEKEINKFLATGERILRSQEDQIWQRLFAETVFEWKTPCQLNGYRVPEVSKIASMISFFDKVKGIQLYKTKLNKLLFYCDFNSYKLSGYSISGMTYRAIQYGPVPSHFDKLYVLLCDEDKLIINERRFDNGHFGDQILSNSSFEDTFFSPLELEIMESVARELGSLKTDEIVGISHEEQAWQCNQESRSLINYKFAFDLKKTVDHNGVPGAFDVKKMGTCEN